MIDTKSIPNILSNLKNLGLQWLKLIDTTIGNFENNHN